MIEDQSKKQDWGKSNKLVAFNLDIGRFNQGVFTSFDVNMNSGQKTAEEIRMLEYTSNQGGGINVTPQSQSMYNFYKYRIYTCDVSMIGNALIQPKMYFNLRNVPMFSGPYQIQKVSHNITAGNFSTTFSGTRQPVYEISTQDSYLQTIYKNFVTPLLTKAKTEASSNISTNIIGQQSSKMNVVNGPNTPGPNSCEQNLSSSFNSLTYEASSATTLSITDIVNSIKTVVNSLPTSSTLSVDQKNVLRYLTFMVGYISNYENTTFKINGFNFGNVPLNINYSADLNEYIINNSSSYFCQNLGGNENVPVASFTGGVNSSIYIIASKFSALVKSGGDSILSNLTDALLLNPDNTTLDYFAKTYIVQWPNLVDENVYTQLQPSDKETLITEIKDSFSLAKTLGLNT
jgi:hypothetical protein